MDEIVATLINQLPNMAIALLALAYLARQNDKVVDKMSLQNDRLFVLLEKLCAGCIEEKGG